MDTLGDPVEPWPGWIRTRRSCSRVLLVGVERKRMFMEQHVWVLVGDSDGNGSGLFYDRRVTLLSRLSRRSEDLTDREACRYQRSVYAGTRHNHRIHMHQGSLIPRGVTRKRARSTFSGR